MVIQLTSDAHFYQDDIPTYDAMIDGHADHLIQKREDGSLWMDHMYLGEHGTTLEYVPVPEDAVVLPYEKDASYTSAFSTDFLEGHGVQSWQDFLLVGDNEARVFRAEGSDGLDTELSEAFWSEKTGYADFTAKKVSDAPATELQMFVKGQDKPQSFLLIASSDAERAYQDASCHEKIAKAMDNPDVVEFLKDAEALSYVREAPVAAALVDGAVLACKRTGGTNPHDGWMEKNVAERLQSFKKEDFARFVDDLVDCGEVSSLVDEPFQASVELSLQVPNYIAGMNRQKNSPLSRGIEQALHEKNYEKLHGKLDGFFRGDRKTIKALKEAGKAADRSSR